MLPAIGWVTARARCSSATTQGSLLAYRGFALGYGLILDGLRGQLRPAPTDFGTSLYFSATTLVPLSYGDVIPIGVAARLVTIGESATGLVVAALAITLLFSLYESFQDREKLVVTLDALAGAPPSGVQILETASEHGMKDELIRNEKGGRSTAPSGYRPCLSGGVKREARCLHLIAEARQYARNAHNP